MVKRSEGFERPKVCFKGYIAALEMSERLERVNFFLKSCKNLREQKVIQECDQLF